MEMLHAAFSPVNVVFTVLVILMVIYWLMVIIGALDVSFLDVDLPDVGLDSDVDVDMDVGGDVDVDMDADVDVDADGDIDMAGEGVLHSALHFFYVGEVPVMVLTSILILSLWAISILGNHYLNPAGSAVIGLGLLLGNLFVSLFICKFFAMPFKRLFAMFDKDSNAPRPVMGRICRVRTSEVSQRLGQAEMSGKGAVILLNVVAEKGYTFKKGDEVIVTGKDEKTGVYTVGPVDLEK